MLLYAPHCGGATSGDDGGAAGGAVQSFMRDFLEAMEVEMSRYNLDFVVWIEMEVTLFPIKVPAPGQKQSGEFGWANNKYRG